MQETTSRGLDLTFPKEYLQRLEEHRKRQLQSLSKRRRIRKSHATPSALSDNCKQAIYLADKVYCCVLKELIEGSLCKGCPCYEREPLEYSLFLRV